MEEREILRLLELQELQDEKTIKKAYAKAVRKHHPEEDPEIFTQLQEAYHQALQKLSSKQKQDPHTSTAAVFEDVEGRKEQTEAGSVSAFLSKLCSLIQENDASAMEAYLQQTMQDAYVMNEEVLIGLCDFLHSQENEISYSMRRVLIKAFHLQEDKLSTPQAKLRACIQQDVLQFENYRFSFHRDWEYLYNTWQELTNMEQEDTSAWLHFLHTKNWNREELSEEQAAAILTLEINKQYAHSSVVAGKIYSFLQIREHLAQDEHQIYARLKLVLGKDANFKGESFLDWQNRIYWEYTALKQFGSGHRINEWRVFLRKVMKEQEDLVLLDLLAQYMKNKRYPRVIRKELRKHYHLDKKDYLHQQLREAIKIVDRKVTIRIFLLLLLYFFVVCIFNGTRSAQKEVKRKEMQPVTQEQFRQSNEENMKELHKILEGLKNK